ncbi:hypothetical protein ROHU_022728 [Labeo rohita]|uniref:Uncharacterized protein n=1 Tax=Labeo rohita TaxID=84645 RepID=A0A498MVV5_LABRO|nr:hypothetical protein ROHU_022728 [Labeo rohita]
MSSLSGTIIRHRSPSALARSDAVQRCLLSSRSKASLMFSSVLHRIECGIFVTCNSSSADPDRLKLQCSV